MSGSAIWFTVSPTLGFFSNTSLILPARDSRSELSFWLLLLLWLSCSSNLPLRVGEKSFSFLIYLLCPKWSKSGRTIRLASSLTAISYTVARSSYESLSSDVASLRSKANIFAINVSVPAAFVCGADSSTLCFSSRALSFVMKLWRRLSFLIVFSVTFITVFAVLDLEDFFFYFLMWPSSLSDSVSGVLF